MTPPTFSQTIPELAPLVDAVARWTDENAVRRLDAFQRLADVVSDAARRDQAMARLEAALVSAP
jgi:hypothetical protein